MIALRGEKKTEDQISKPVSRRWKTKGIMMNDQLGHS